eukprot:766098-Hanusia_phi.AAC.7
MLICSAHELAGDEPTNYEEGKLSAKQIARMGGGKGSSEPGTDQAKAKAKKRRKKEESEIKRGKQFLDEFDARMREKIALSVASRMESESAGSYKTTSFNFEDSDFNSSTHTASKVVPYFTC